VAVELSEVKRCETPFTLFAGQTITRLLGHLQSPRGNTINMVESSEEDDRKPAALDKNAKASPSRASVKPALKKQSKPSAKDKHLKWDEQAIEEHDLLRGTRMKIDEPNTPYTQYDSGAESDDSRRPKSPANQKQTLSWDNLERRLDSVAAVQHQYPSSPETSSHASDAEEERTKEMRKLEFKEHRKRHYNEMDMVKKFRQEHPEDFDADVEDGNVE